MSLPARNTSVSSSVRLPSISELTEKSQLSPRLCALPKIKEKKDDDLGEESVYSPMHYYKQSSMYHHNYYGQPMYYGHAPMMNQSQHMHLQQSMQQSMQHPQQPMQQPMIYQPPPVSQFPIPYVVPEVINKPINKCHRCGTTETPEWRRGPNGVRTLCNACGLFHAKLVKRKGAALAAEEVLNNKVCKGKNGRRISIKKHLLNESLLKTNQKQLFPVMMNGYTYQMIRN